MTVTLQRVVWSGDSQLDAGPVQRVRRYFLTRSLDPRSALTRRQSVDSVVVRCLQVTAQPHTHTHTHTRPFNGLLSGTTRVGRYQKKVYELDSPLRQPLSRSSLVFLLALDPQLHTPCISSPNHHHLFAAHAHTNAACFAAIPMLCHLYLVSRTKGR